MRPSDPITEADVMLRLMGLPATGRCPRVAVRRHRGGIQLRFTGPDCDQPVDVDRRLLGPGADLEREELALMAELRRRGYEVQRLAPDDDGS
ncbi:MAG TPA: hypothetical protein VNT03_04570 [Baekduia sp.]|nr:hypothetical protein [Baekduia sp.]